MGETTIAIVIGSKSFELWVSLCFEFRTQPIGIKTKHFGYDLLGGSLTSLRIAFKSDFLQKTNDGMCGHNLSLANCWTIQIPSSFHLSIKNVSLSI